MFKSIITAHNNIDRTSAVLGSAVIDENPSADKKGYNYMLDRLSLLLVIVGALNWGGIGLFKFDAVAWLCGGQDAILARIIYTLVALGGLWCISLLFRPRERADY